MNIGWIFLICALVILALMAFVPRWRKEQVMGSVELSARLDALDADLTRVDEVIGCMRAGQKINAIKIYREDTGASRSDAKAAVERMELATRLDIKPREKKPSGEVAKARTDSLNRETEHLLIQGNKIRAIKLYREQTGLGLREAKEAVEDVERALLLHGPAFAHKDGATLEAPSGVPVVTAPSEEVRQLVLVGEKIRAIKLHREQTGLGLREAKAAVDLLERSLRCGLEQA